MHHIIHVTPNPNQNPNLVAGCQRHSSSSGTDATPKSADRESTCAAAICGRPNLLDDRWLNSVGATPGILVVKVLQTDASFHYPALKNPALPTKPTPRMLATIAVMRKRESSSHETSGAYIISTFTICIISILSIGIICIDSRSIACTPGIKACYLMMV